MVLLEMINPPSCFSVDFDRILAIHKVIGYVPAGKISGEKWPIERADVIAIEPDDIVAIG